MNVLSANAIRMILEAKIREIDIQIATKQYLSNCICYSTEIEKIALRVYCKSNSLEKTFQTYKVRHRPCLTMIQVWNKDGCFDCYSTSKLGL